MSYVLLNFKTKFFDEVDFIFSTLFLQSVSRFSVKLGVTEITNGVTFYHRGIQASLSCVGFLMVSGLAQLNARATTYLLKILKVTICFGEENICYYINLLSGDS